MDPAKSLTNIIFRLEKFKLGNLISSGLPNAAIFSTSTSIGQLILMIYSLLIARWLGPDLFGIISASYAVGSLSVFLINWGMDTWLLRKAATESDPRLLAAKVLQIKMLFGIGWGPLLWIVFTSVRPDVYLPGIFALSIIDVALESGFNTLVSTFTAKNRIKLVSVLIVLSRFLRLVSALILIGLNIKWLELFVIARLSCTLIIFIAALWILRPGIFRPVRLPFRNVIHESLPYGASDFLAVVYGQIDVVMISLMIERIFIGWYSPAISIINALVTAISSSYVYFIPRVTSILQNPKVDFRNLVQKLVTGYLILGAALWAGLALFGEAIVLLVLGEHYQTSAELIRILSPILFLKSLSMCCAVILVATGWQKHRLIPQVVSALSNVTLNLWAIPRYGIQGAANVYVASEAILFVGYAYWTIRYILSYTQTKV